ncbi:transposase [uncultured Prevotella sp.]|uniref:IS66 family transposase n=1 Tax=Leyella stercorea TaxID=363265 RepID=UPI0027FD18F4|nr:transposase [Leyella stercorea]
MEHVVKTTSGLDLNVGNIQIDNNCCERAVRPFTNLRKSFGGFSSENGESVK